VDLAGEPTRGHRAVLRQVSKTHELRAGEPHSVRELSAIEIERARDPSKGPEDAVRVRTHDFAAEGYTGDAATEANFAARGAARAASRRRSASCCGAPSRERAGRRAQSAKPRAFARSLRLWSGRAPMWLMISDAHSAPSLPASRGESPFVTPYKKPAA